MLKELTTKEALQSKPYTRSKNKECSNCGKEFRAEESFCSRDCFMDARKKQKLARSK